MKIFKYADLVLQISGSIVAPPLAGVFLGRFLDSRFHTDPVITLVLIALGLATGIRSLLRLSSSIQNDKEI